jgi:hypothetical protein
MPEVTPHQPNDRREILRSEADRIFSAPVLPDPSIAPSNKSLGLAYDGANFTICAAALELIQGHYPSFKSALEILGVIESFPSLLTKLEGWTDADVQKAVAEMVSTLDNTSPAVRAQREQGAEDRKNQLGGASFSGRRPAES